MVGIGAGDVAGDVAKETVGEVACVWQRIMLAMACQFFFFFLLLCIVLIAIFI